MFNESNIYILEYNQKTEAKWSLTFPVMLTGPAIFKPLFVVETFQFLSSVHHIIHTFIHAKGVGNECHPWIYIVARLSAKA